MENGKNEQYVWSFVFSLVYVLLITSSTIFLNSIDRLPSSISLFDFILLALVVFRLTHLFVFDAIMNFVRSFFSRFEKGPGKTISNLLSCPWCTSVWMALFVVFFYALTPLMWYPYLIIAVAGVGIFIEVTAYKLFFK